MTPLLAKQENIDSALLETASMDSQGLEFHLQDYGSERSVRASLSSVKTKSRALALSLKRGLLGGSLRRVWKTKFQKRQRLRKPSLQTILNLIIQRLDKQEEEWRRELEARREAAATGVIYSHAFAERRLRIQAGLELTLDEFEHQ